MSEPVIAFDTWALHARFRYSGIFGYAKGLLRQFQLLAQDAGVRVLNFVASGYPNDAAEFSSGRGFRAIESPYLSHSTLWKLGGVMRTAIRNGADVLFCPSAEVLPYPLIPVVTTIHDLTPFTAPSFPMTMNFRIKTMMRIAAIGSRSIITDSHCSKRDMMEILNVPPERVHVVYLGFKSDVFNSTEIDPAEIQTVHNRYGIRRPYLIHHGTIQPRKNLERLMAAYQLLMERDRDMSLDLVLVGANGWQYEGILRAAENCRRGRVIVAGAVPDHELAVLLKGAELSVIPSLYEGFCYPMIESMACSVPTVVSSSSCLPEVSGGVLQYFEPTSIEDMCAAITKVLNDSACRARLRECGVNRAKEFTWERCGRETLEAIKSATQVSG